MIVITEGPRCSGKSMFVNLLCKNLKIEGISASTWKVSRGKDPVSDMLNSLINFVGDRVWILDRFHLTEWTNSFILKRGWTLIDEWVEIEEGLEDIDDKLRERRAIIVLLTARAHVLKERWVKTKREDIEDDPEHILKMWEETLNLTKCDIIHLHNDTQQMLIRNVNIVIDLVKGRIK